jgi:histidine triad (HIT) family protein
VCIFCKVARREIPAKIVLESDDAVAFHDLNPGAPTHVLVIPKKHIESLAHLTGEDAELVGKLMVMARKVAETTGIAESGFRTVVNAGPDAGQTVSHLHVHVLGGRAMSWPPG